MKWEYMVIFWGRGSNELEKSLNVWGDDRWELIDRTPSAGMADVLIFKREKVAE